MNVYPFPLQTLDQDPYLLWLALAAVLQGTNPGPGLVTAGSGSLLEPSLWTMTSLADLDLDLDRCWTNFTDPDADLDLER